MRTAAAVLTWNLYETGRLPLFRRTLGALHNEGLPVFVVDNGSTDQTRQLVEDLGGWRNRTGNWTIGGGMNAAISILAEQDIDLCVFSQDDAAWKPGFLARAISFWEDAPGDIALASGLLEQRVWWWNQPYDVLEYGGERVLWRETAPSVGWVYPRINTPLILPVPDLSNVENDAPVCRRLNAQGYKVVQADWLEHTGDGHSTWGNKTAEHGEPLDPKWGFV